jgi:hypothetical protein
MLTQLISRSQFYIYDVLIEDADVAVESSGS